MLEIIKSPSPNFDARKAPISMLVLHYTGMESGQAALDRMCDPNAKVSAHYMVEEDGRIFQLVSEDDRAWHAGVASWQGLDDINSRSIGIEIVNGGHDFDLPDFSDVQNGAVTLLCADILLRYDITHTGVVGHSDIAPGRKQDPGERFPWRRLSDAGIGFWPRAAAMEPVDDTGVAEALRVIGYGVEMIPDASLEACLAAFQRRWRPENITGEADEETRRILGLVSSRYAKARK